MKLLTLAAVTVLATTASGRVATQPSGDLFLTSAIHLDRNNRRHHAPAL